MRNVVAYNVSFLRFTFSTKLSKIQKSYLLFSLKIFLSLAQRSLLWLAILFHPVPPLSSQLEFSKELTKSVDGHMTA